MKYGLFGSIVIERKFSGYNSIFEYPWLMGPDNSKPVPILTADRLGFMYMLPVSIAVTLFVNVILFKELLLYIATVLIVLT